MSNVMARQRHTPEQRQQAIDLALESGQSEASRRTGIPIGTIVSWMSRAGLTTHATETLAVANHARALTLAQRRAKLAEDLMGDIERLRLQLFAPCLERKAMSAAGVGIEVVDIHHAQPTFGDKKALMTTIAIAIDKVLLLSGEATQRTELLGAPDRARAEQRLAKVLELKAVA